MRKYIVKSSEYGEEPSAGIMQKFIKIASHYDGWCAIDFLKELERRERPLENSNAEIFFCIGDDSEETFSLPYLFYDSEEDMINNKAEFPYPRYFRMFSYNEDFGLEELEIL